MTPTAGMNIPWWLTPWKPANVRVEVRFGDVKVTADRPIVVTLDVQQIALAT